jgi:hypothetical protein
MIPSLRLFALLVFALCLALPSIGGDGEGGENGGGTGVWVLPRAGYITPPSGMPPRMLRTISMAQDCLLEMEPSVGVASGTFVDDVLQLPVALTINGMVARIPSDLLQSLSSASASATVLLADASQLGYLIEITANGNGTATLAVY